MQDTEELARLAFAALVFIFVTRAWRARRVPAARLTWLASGIGALGLLARGAIIPLPILDSWLGGTNVNNLLQNVLATVALWLVMQAVVTRGRSTLTQLRWWPLAALVAVFSAAFFCIDRGSTARDFVVERSDQPALLIYVGVYMAGIAWMCMYLIAKVWRGRSWSYWVLIAGATLLAGASLVEIVFLVTQCFGWGSAATRGFLGPLFEPLFYPGIVLIAMGVAVFAAQRRRRSRSIQSAIATLEDLMRRRGIPLPDRLPIERDQALAEGALSYLYELLIVVHDDEQGGRITLSDRERDTVASADATISAELLEATRDSSPGHGWFALDPHRSAEAKEGLV